jgi:chromosome segregation ATPase
MKQITYFTISELCQALIQTGIKPSVRTIREKLGGGSFATITEHLRHWREERALAQESDMMISQELQQSILAEFTQVAKRVEARLQRTLQEKEQDLIEATEELVRVTKELHQLKHHAQELQNTLDIERLEYEKRNAGNASTIEYLTREKDQLHQALGEANRLRHQSEVDKAVAETRTEALEKQIANIKK